MRLETTFAKLISYLLHPLLMPTYLLGFLFSWQAYFAMVLSAKAKWMLLGLIFTNTFILPVLLFLLLIHRRVIESVHMRLREERFLPLLITGGMYFLTFYFLRRLQISPVYYLFFLGASLMVVVALIVNFYTKISLHTLSIGAVLGAFIGVAIRFNMAVVPYILALILLSGLVGFARLKLNAHKPYQVYLGFLVGVSVMLMLFLIP